MLPPQNCPPSGKYWNLLEPYVIYFLLIAFNSQVVVLAPVCFNSGEEELINEYLNKF